jgi:glycosyltransferase involved in cell wall biosynthesis
MSGKIKAVVAFAGARDGYQLPLALSEAGLLEALVTDMYWPVDKSWFRASVGRAVPPRILRARFCEGLDSRTVRVSGLGWAMSVCGSVAPQLGLNRYGDKSLSRKARAIALHKAAALFCCSYYAFEAFSGNGERPRHRFLFQLHPHPKTVRDILGEEIERTPIAKLSLAAEPDLSLPERDFQALCGEPQLANGWVVASSYTRETLSANGIPADQINVAPYGVDGNAFAERSQMPSPQAPFTVVFVGSLIQRKGLSYLLDAIRLLTTRALRVMLCGRGLVDRRLIEQYPDLNLEIHIGLSQAELVRKIHQADVFVMPSLAEGFGHVILEAMSCGVPVIATPHTCAPDVMTDGSHGFIVPIRNAETIAEKLAWGIDNRRELAVMGQGAAAQARRFTWERFRISVRESYGAMLAAAQ